MTEFQIRIQQISRYLLAGAVVLLAAVPFIWAPGSLFLPLGRDQGIFAWVGGVILSGGLPYADAWEVKGPLSHFLYALALFAFGKSELAIRIMDLVICTTGVFAAGRIGAIAGRKWVGLITAGLVISIIQFDFWESAQPDGWAAIALLWSVALIAQKKLSRQTMFGSGLLLGLAVLIKPHYALFAIMPLTRLAMEPRDSERLKLLLATVAGAALPAAICFLVFAVAGKLTSLWDVLVLFNIEFHASRFPSASDEAHRRLGFILLRPDALVAFVCAGIACVNFRRSDRPLAVLLIVGAVLGFLIAISQGKFWIYHFLPFVLFLSVLAALGIAFLFDGQKRKVAESSETRLFTFWTGRRLDAAAPVLDRLRAFAQKTMLSTIMFLLVAETLTFVAGATAIRLMPPLAHAAGILPEKEWRAQFCQQGWDFCYGDIAEAANVIRGQTPAGAPIFLWGFDALLYVLADRPAASRLGYSYAVLGGNDDYRRGAETEIMADLTRRKPAFIAVQTNESNDLIRNSSASHLPDFPALQNMIATQYVEASRNGSFILYRQVADRSAGHEVVPAR